MRSHRDIYSHSFWNGSLPSYALLVRFPGVKSPPTTFRQTIVAEAGVVVGTRVLGVLAGVVSQIWLARFLAPEGRGAYAVCATFALVVSVIFGLGIDRAIQYHLIVKRFGKADALGMSLLLTVLCSLFAIPAGWYLVELPFSYFDKAPVEVFRLSLVLIPVITLQFVLTLILDGIRLYRFGAIQTAVTSILNVALIILLTSTLDLGVPGAIAAWALSASASAVMQVVYLRVMPRLPSLALQIKVVSYAGRFFFARLGNVVNLEFGMLILGWLASGVEVGLFAAASALVLRTMLLPQALSTVILPHVGEAMDGSPDLVARTCRATGLMLAIGLGVLALVAPVIIPMALSDAFEDAVPLILLLSIGAWARGTTLPLASFFIGINRPGVVSITTVFELACNAALIGPMYVYWGIRGAAVGVAIAYVLTSFLRVAFFRAVSGHKSLGIWLVTTGDIADIVRTIKFRLQGNSGASR